MFKSLKRVGRNSRTSTGSRCLALVVTLFMGVILAGNLVMAAAGGETKSADGLTVYLGVIPAEVVRGPDPHATERHMHGGPSRGAHGHHIVVAVFDSTTKARITDATVIAKVSGLGLSGSERTMEQMTIADTVTYGAYFDLTRDLYAIRLTVRRPGAQSVVLDFRYDHRRP